MPKVLAFGTVALVLFSSVATAQQRDRHSSSTVTGPGGRSATRSVDSHGTPDHRTRTTTVTGPEGHSATRTVHVERWRRPPPPPAYRGPQPGYYFAPGYGYYHVEPGWYRRTWAIGVVVPAPLRAYYVVDPTIYALAPAPAGMRWIYVGNRIALIRISSGVIIQLGPVFW